MKPLETYQLSNITDKIVIELLAEAVAASFIGNICILIGGDDINRVNKVLDHLYQTTKMSIKMAN